MRQWMAGRLGGFRDSVFEEMNALAEQYGVNLGSGTPDLETPAAVQAAAAEAVARGRNQYAPVRGEMVLREAIADHARRFYGQEVDPASEVTVTSGVTEGIYAALFSVVEPGDEVVVFEPFYDCYVPSIRMAGGIPVPVTLHAPAFRFDPRELRAAFSSRTKALLLNTPHNPTGTVFSRDELTLIAELCQEFDVLAIADEVYEHIVFEPAMHVRLATLPGMGERTLTLSGAGKTLSCTGWRIGWAIGPAALHDALARLRQFTVFSASTPLQWGVLSAAAAEAAIRGGSSNLSSSALTTATFRISAGRLRNARPSPAASRMGKTNTQNRWSGYRINSRILVRISCTSGRSLITQAAPRQRHEYVL